MREDVADPATALSMPAERKRTLHQIAGNGRDRLDVFARIEAVTVQARQKRLVVERVHLAGAAVHEELNDAFGASAMVQATVERRIRTRRVGEQSLFAQELRERHAAEAAAQRD